MLLASGESSSPGLTIPQTRNWYVLQVAPNRDESACQRLAAHDVHCYSPTYRPIGSPRALRLFPGYVFAQLALPDELPKINANPYAIWVCGVGRKPQPVPAHEVQWVRELSAMRSAQPEEAIYEGDWVRVVRGPLAVTHVEGRVIRSRGVSRLVIQASLLERGVSVEIDRQDLQVIRHHA